jgi:alpha-glucosidase (family GH31 glycosyl hydrolase)
MSLNDHPHSGVHSHEASYDAMAKALGHDTKDKLPILFDPTSKKFIDAFNDVLHGELERQGCDFWWIDWQQGRFSRVPGIDPLWVLNHFCFEANRTPTTDTGKVDNKRPLVFSRYAGPGSHRYPVGFSGDTVTTWASLQFQPEFTATASNIGYGWWSHDIGGHMFGNRDDELVTRWVQLGVLSPVMRLHSTNSLWMGKEPWMYRKESEVVIEAWMRWRHRLVVYLYSLDVLASREVSEEKGHEGDGWPLVTPLYWHWPERDETYQFKNEYMFGTELLVAPIVEKREDRTGLAPVKAWLPEGKRWVDIFRGTVYDGDRTLNLYRSLGEVPVLAHEGSIVPLDANLKPENGTGNAKAFEVLVVVGKDGHFSVIEDPDDDEEEVKKLAPGSDSSERESSITWNQKEGKLSAAVQGRTWSFRFLALADKPKDLKVSVGGKDVTADVKVSVQSYPETPSLLVECPAPKESAAKYDIEISLGSDPQLAVIDHKPHIKQMLLDYQTEFALKDKIWNIVDSKAPSNAKVGRLLALGVDNVLLEPVIELVLSDSRGL